MRKYGKKKKAEQKKLLVHTYESAFARVFANAKEAKKRIPYFLI